MYDVCGYGRWHNADGDSVLSKCEVIQWTREWVGRHGGSPKISGDDAIYNNIGDIMELDINMFLSLVGGNIPDGCYVCLIVDKGVDGRA